YDVTLQPRPGGGQSVVNQGQREMADVVRSNSETQVRFYTNTGRMTWISDRRVESIKTCL
ncbi:hypothetical protein, partial [Pseudomonas sp.]|uniref:hypothetical protein n=1 Tax=Pseudomonas sp. TaxID=306 RepID=UPI003CC5D5BC